MNPMDFLHPSSKNSLSIARIAGVLTAAAAAAVLARFAVPYSMAAVSAAIPRLWSSIRFFVVPPYLFITVNLIIVAIWKLSDHKIHKNLNGKPADAVAGVDPNVTPSKTVPAEIPSEFDVDAPVSVSKSAESCLTTESDSNSPVSLRFEDFDIKESEAEGMGLEDTWQTIVMKKSATWNSSSYSAAKVSDEGAVRRSVTFNESPPAAVDGHDELNQRFEAFIKKNYDQIRSY